MADLRDFKEKFDEWNSVGGKLKPRSGSAPNGIAVGTESSLFDAEGDVAGGEFENEAANISHDGTSWSNDLLQTNILEGITVTSASNWTDNQDCYFLNGLDNGLSRVAAIKTNVLCEWDAGSAQDVTNFSFEWNIEIGKPGYIYFTIEYKVESGDSWSTAYTTSNAGSGIQGGWKAYSVDFTLVNGRYFKFTFGVTTNASNWFREGGLNNEAVHSTLNTIDAIMTTAGENSFAPASLKIFDELSEVADDTVKIDYSYTGSGGFTGSLITLDLFKALEASLFAGKNNLKLQVQPQGSQAFSKVQIETISSDISLSENGILSQNVDGVSVMQFDALGNIETGGNTKVTTVATSAYDLLVDDYNLMVTYTATSPVSGITLPTAQTLDGRQITIKDAGYNAETNNIVIDTEGSAKINNSVSEYVIDADGDSITLKCDGTDWHRI